MTATIDNKTKVSLFAVVTCVFVAAGVVVKIVFWAADVEAKSNKVPIIEKNIIKMDKKLDALMINRGLTKKLKDIENEVSYEETF